jgi:hypothetical protein
MMQFPKRRRRTRTCFQRPQAHGGAGLGLVHPDSICFQSQAHDGVKHRCCRPSSVAEQPLHAHLTPQTTFLQTSDAAQRWRRYAYKAAHLTIQPRQLCWRNRQRVGGSVRPHREGLQSRQRRPLQGHRALRGRRCSYMRRYIPVLLARRTLFLNYPLQHAETSAKRRLRPLPTASSCAIRRRPPRNSEQRDSLALPQRLWE